MAYLIPFFGLTLAIALLDFRTRKIPNSLILLGAVYALLISLTGHGAMSPLDFAVGTLVGGLIFFYPYYKSWVGAGDVKLMMITGGMLGPQAVSIAALYAAIIGGAYVLLLLLSKRIGQGVALTDASGSQVPYAFAISLGGCLSVLKPGL
jgi:Flp pilus assembly protein protease CpaA